MAARPWRVTTFALVGAILVWVWGLTGVTFALRWNAVERPGPPIKELFPYGEMRIGVDASYPPFAVATATDLFGLDIDLGRALGERLQVPVRFVNMGFDGIYDSLRADQVDVVISALLVDPARMGDVLYTQSYFDAGLVLVTPANTAYESMEDMSGYSVAYEFGSQADLTAHTWLRRIAPFTTQAYELPRYALDAVRLGQADGALADATSARMYLREYPDWDVSLNYVTHAIYAIALRSDRGRTWEAVNGALGVLIEDGTVAAILDEWL